MLSEKRSTFSERRDQSGPSCSKGGNRYPPDKSVSTVDNAISFHDTYPLDSDIRWIALSLLLTNRGQAIRQVVSYERLKTMKNVKTVAPKGGRSHC